MMLFTVGACIYLNGYHYRIEEARRDVYLLSQTVVVHEHVNEYFQYWLSSYIDSHARRSIKCPNEKDK